MDPQNQNPAPAPAPSVPQTAAEVAEQLKMEFGETISQMDNRFQQLQAELAATQAKLEQTQAASSAVGGGGGRAKANKPTAFKGDHKTNVQAWISQMEMYIKGESPDRAFAVAMSYLEGDAYTWFETYKSTTNIETWELMRDALLERFNPLDKALVARDKLAKWRQIKDVTTYNRDFRQILLDIPDITETEKLDRYTRGLKQYIWEPLCINKYDTLEQCMTDALKVEAAKRGSKQRMSVQSGSKPMSYGSSTSGPVPMDLSATELKKLTPEERERCMKEGLCLRCREKGHLARSCPKATGRSSNE